MPACTVSGLSFDEYGTGPLAVLVHGSPGTGQSWQRVAERLAARFCVIAPDLPGYGESPSLLGGPAVHLAETIRLLGELVATRGAPALLAGHSYGGVVALTAALRGVIRPGALALFEPVALPILDAPEHRRAFSAARQFFDGYVARVASGDQRAIGTVVDYWLGAGAFAALPAPMQTYLVANADRNARDVSATMLAPLSAEACRALAMPVTVVYGALSPDIAIAIARAISAAAPRGSLLAVDGAGHALTTTHVSAVARILEELAESTARCEPHAGGPRLPSPP
jgi:pimeloyl-ACP methyl ester carboxylesterase